MAAIPQPYPKSLTPSLNPYSFGSIGPKVRVPSHVIPCGQYHGYGRQDSFTDARMWTRIIGSRHGAELTR